MPTPTSCLPAPTGLRPALAAALLLAGACGMPQGPARPAKLDLPRATKVTARNVSPGIDPASHAAQPVTIYRLGERYGRVEYAPDPETGAHLLIVVREPYAWVVDLAAEKMRFGYDEGPTHVFRAPILPDDEGVLPPPLQALEFGKEMAFLRRHDAAVTRTQREDGTEVLEHRADFGPYSVVVVTGPDASAPIELGVFAEGELVRAWRYLEHRDDLLPTNAMFAVPEGMEFVPGPDGPSEPPPDAAAPEFLDPDLPDAGGAPESTPAR